MKAKISFLFATLILLKENRLKKNISESEHITYSNVIKYMYINFHVYMYISINSVKNLYTRENAYNVLQQTIQSPLFKYTNNG